MRPLMPGRQCHSELHVETIYPPAVEKVQKVPACVRRDAHQPPTGARRKSPFSEKAIQCAEGWARERRVWVRKSCPHRLTLTELE